MTSVPSEPRVLVPPDGLEWGSGGAARAVRRWAALLARPVLTGVATMLGSTALLLTLLVLAPGDPIDLMPNGEAVRAQLTADFGLDRPLPVRWALQFGRLARLDLGTSYAFRVGAPVSDVIAAPAVRSAGLLGGSAALAVTLGTGLAFVTGGRSALPRWSIQAVSLLPTFLIASLGIEAIDDAAWWGIEHGWWARPSWFALPDQASGMRTALALTVLAVGSSALSEVHGELEDAVIRLRTSPWVDAARARGAATWPLVLRGLLPPLAATIANRSAVGLGGVVVVEKVFLINGVGAVLWEAARLRDYELALSIALLAAVVVAGTRLGADVLRLLLDPRLREVR